MGQLPRIVWSLVGDWVLSQERRQEDLDWIEQERQKLYQAVKRERDPEICPKSDKSEKTA
jgi:hypothetical protein